MQIKLFAGSFLGALLAAGAADAAERLPFGAPSEPTIFGHAVAPKKSRVAIEPIDLRREVPAVHARGFQPSEPTIWGHRPETPR